jgi:hypothetical protein
LKHICVLLLESMLWSDQEVTNRITKLSEESVGHNLLYTKLA